MEIKQRLFEQEISKWYTSSSGDSLVVMGARQVGKTTGILNWAKTNNIRICYYDMKLRKDLKDFFASASSYESVLKAVSIEEGISVDEIDVIFIDEVQVDKNILYLARIFKHKKVKLILSGSLLGMKLSASVERTDVGSKHYLRVYPLDFKEFLIWTNNQTLLEVIEDAFNKKQQILPNIHQKLLNLYQQYLLVGGMPEVVSIYIDNNKQISDNLYAKKSEIINEYIRDNNDSANFDKKLSAATRETLNLIYKNIATFVIRPNSKKFSFEEVKKGFRYRNFAVPLNIIKDCNIVLSANNVEGTTFPLFTHMLDASMKLYYSDVGLLTSFLGLTEKSLVNWCNEGTNSDIWGGVFENAIACDLQKEQLFFKKWSSNGNTYEIDFLIQWENDEVYPVEVKSKPKNTSKASSLNRYNLEFKPKHNLFIGPNNFHWNENTIMIPLYATYLLRKYIK